MRRYDGAVKGSQSRFFIDSDFDAFDPKYATSNDPKIIAARKFVVENRMRYLNNDQDSGEGLADFFRKYDIHPHWRKQNLTNIFWPLPVVNGGYVDYLKMGYGKEKDMVKELTRRSCVFRDITDMGTRDIMVFHCVTQLQIGINYYGWWINLYIDKTGWIEEYNLLKRISIGAHKAELIDLLEEINRQGYDFYIYHGDPYFHTHDPEDFLEHMEYLRREKKTFSISIEKVHNRDAKENNMYMLSYLKNEFIKLLPLYNFISWHPQRNNYIGI